MGRALGLDGNEVGAIRVDLRRVFAGVSEQIRYARIASDGTPNTRLTPEEIEAPLSDGELTEAVAKVAKVANELWYEAGLLEELLREVETILPAVDHGPEETLQLLKRLWSIEDIRSRRLVRAISAIASANHWQSEPDSARKRELMKERPERFRPMAVKTQSVAGQLERLLTRPAFGRCRSGCARIASLTNGLNPIRSISLSRKWQRRSSQKSMYRR